MTDTLTQEEMELLKCDLNTKLASDDVGMVKEGLDAVNDFTRIKMREDGFFRRIMPPIPITNDDLDRQLETTRPVKIVDLEPDSPAAMSVGFGTLPDNLYIKMRRYKVTCERIMTRNFTTDVDDLRTNIIDIRQVISDNSIRDMLAEEDGKLLRAVNACVVGPGMVVPTSGTVQYQVLSGGITRDSLWESLKVLPRTPSSLEVHTVLLNNITVKEVAKMTRNEWGGDIAADVMRDGWTSSEFQGVRWLITIKKGLVPSGTMYHFADPKFIGKSYVLEDTTLFVERKAFFLNWFAYELLGAAIGNTSGVARVDFT